MSESAFAKIKRDVLVSVAAMVVFSILTSLIVYGEKSSQIEANKKAIEDSILDYNKKIEQLDNRAEKNVDKVYERLGYIEGRLDGMELKIDKLLEK